MKPLTIDQILAIKLKTETVFIPEWDSHVIIQEPTGLQRSEFEILSRQSADNDEALKKIRGFCAAKCIVDDNGKRLFNDDDIVKFLNTSANALDRILNTFSGLSFASEDDIEAAAKN